MGARCDASACQHESRRHQPIGALGVDDSKVIRHSLRHALPRHLFHNGTVDQKNGRLYFTVRNQTTAGNVNATTALFAYNITDKTMKLLDKKEYTNGFGTLFGSLYPYGEGWGGNTGFSVAGKYYVGRIYNRVLSATEVKQNFNATRGRYGI